MEEFTLCREVVVEHSKFGKSIHLVHEEVPCFLRDVNRRLDLEEEDRKSERGIATIVNIQYTSSMSMSSISSLLSLTPPPQWCVGVGLAASQQIDQLDLDLGGDNGP